MTLSFTKLVQTTELNADSNHFTVCCFVFVNGIVSFSSLILLSHLFTYISLAQTNTSQRGVKLLLMFIPATVYIRVFRISL